VLAGARLWPSTLEPDERAVLERRDRLSASSMHPDILVVGGGIMGIAIARACEEERTGKVLLVESGELGSGATGGAIGLCSPEPHYGLDPQPLTDLGRKSLDGWRALHGSFPGGVGLVDIDWVGLLEDERDIAGRSPAAELLSVEEVHRLVPGLLPSQPGMRLRGQARVNPLFASARIAATLGSVATGVRAISVTVRGGAVRSVDTTAGTISPGAVVFATGNPPEFDELELRVHADLVKGHVVVTEPAPVLFDGTIDPVATQLVDGRLIIGGTLDDDQEPSITLDKVAALLTGLTFRLPALRGIAAERAWCCFRPHHGHGLPVIDRIGAVDNAWFTSGHYRTGILMAPATGSLIAEWLSTDERPALAAPFEGEAAG
jgi:glycine oxidase